MVVGGPATAWLAMAWGRGRRVFLLLDPDRDARRGMRTCGGGEIDLIGAGEGGSGREIEIEEGGWQLTMTQG